MRIKPGWYLLGAALLYAFVVTLAWRQSERRLAELARARPVATAPERPKPAPAPPEKATTVSEGAPGYVLPLPGACIPKKKDHLPGAPRPYRKGVSYGFVFTGKDACVPVVYGTGVIAAAGGEVIKADRDYKPLSPAAFNKLIQSVKNGADLAAMDALRGREVWIRHPDGRVSVYAHLAKIAPHVRVGARVARGDWIGNVGNSGTSYEVRGTQEGARLLFELWEGSVQAGRYFGQGQAQEEVRKAARTFFKHLSEAP